MFGFPLFLVILVISFLLGSIPSGVVIGRVFYHTDIRKQGSGNIGTTNAIRAMGKVGGYTVFIMDFGKGLLSGLIAVALVNAFGQDSTTLPFSMPEAKAIAFLGCGFGHIFSPWLGFHGGKGIAVSVGCLFVTFGPVGALLELALFIVLVIVTKYVSVGSIAAAVACIPLSFYYFWGHPLAILCCCIIAVTVIWAHRENISRLRAGNENRIGSKKKKEGE